MSLVTGCGVRANVAGRQVLVGARRLLERFDVPIGSLAEDVDRLIGAGKTVIVVAVDGQAAGVIAAADVARPVTVAPHPLTRASDRG